MPRRSKRSHQNTLDSSNSWKPDKAEDCDDGDTANFIGDDSGEYSLEEEEPPRKRAKRSHKSKYVGTGSSAKNRKGKIPEQFRGVRGRTGLLEKLAKDVPLDVILEIFCYLDPGDLLRLARTTRDLRGILMSKTSEIVWRTAREGVDELPPLPDDLNEPQFAHLLYESYCHGCGHKPCDTIYWLLRTRCCKSCTRAIFIDHGSSDLMVKVPPELMYGPEVLPSESVKLRRHRYDSYRPDMVDKYAAEFNALKTEDERNAWISRQAEVLKAMKEHKYLCQQWFQARIAGRGEELVNIRDQRKIAILERLEKIGWREEAELSESYARDVFSNHKLVRQPKKLTNHGWKSIETELVQWLAEQKNKRLGEQRSAAIHKRIAMLFKEIKATRSLGNQLPYEDAVFTNEALRELIWETPAEDELSSELLRSKLSEHLPDIVDRWSSAVQESLVEIIQKSRPNATIVDLQLATTVFECTDVAHEYFLMHYPQVLYHKCCLKYCFQSADIRFGYLKWSSENLILSSTGCHMATAIVQGCSLDPATATVQDLWDVNPLIECKSCERQVDGRLFMRWPSAIGDSQHRSRGHSVVINNFGDETPHILACEPLDNLVCGSFPPRCVYCHERPGGGPLHMSLLYRHLLTQHLDAVISANANVVPFPLSIDDLRLHCYRDPTNMRDWSSPFRYRGLPLEPSTPVA